MNKWLVLLAVLVLSTTVFAEVTPNTLFSDHAVLQRDTNIPVWGSASENEDVSVRFAGQTVTTTARDGKWMVSLEPVPAGGPYIMIIAGKNNTVKCRDVLVGDVWVCSGQSNMERQLGPRPGQKPIVNWQQEAAAANYPKIRQFKVPNLTSTRPVDTADAVWSVCSPETVVDFSAVGYFFARDLYQAVDVPIGILFSSWGGTVAEAWTSAETLKTMPDFASAVSRIEQESAQDESRLIAVYEIKIAVWYAENDPGSNPQAPWSEADMDTQAWESMNLPVNWEQASLPDFDGVVWFQKTIDLPENWTDRKAVLSLGPIDDQDTTWVNGVKVGSMDNWQLPRTYPIPANLLKAGRNVITVRVLDTAGGGGIFGRPEQLVLKSQSGDISLAGPWKYKATVKLDRSSDVPRRPGSNPNVPTLLYNGMIAPLQPFVIRGVTWYQGESNNDRARQYRTLFPKMIQDWRRTWGQGDFPFLFVQIAPYRDMSPEIREAQFLTLDKVKNTAMVVITDAGDANDIHPAHKQPVGARLALAARALSYGESIEYSGPLYKSMSVEGNQIVLSFSHTGTGLMALDGPLRGFVIAGRDKKFVPAEARIVGSTVHVWNDSIEKPVAARYGWSDVPDVNLYNKEGLPASPFRTDVD